MYDNAIEAFEHFYTKESGPRNYGYQRDFIYYGITPEHPDGVYNQSINEYISFIQVEPTLFCRIADQPGSAYEGDPEVNVVVKKKSNFTEEEKNHYLNDCWTDGTFCFMFNVATSDKEHTMECPITVRPKDLWIAGPNAIKTWKSRSASMGRHSRYTITLILDSLVSKPYFIDPQHSISIGNWDISKEATERYFSVYEFDLEQTETVTYKMSFTKIKKNKWNINTKGSYGGGSWNAELGGGFDTEADYTDVVEKTVSNTTHKSSDIIGTNIKVRYNDPIIEKDLGNGTYRLKTYDSDGFKFGIAVTY